MDCRGTKYAGDDGKVFKVRSSASINGHLKELAKLAGINKTLTYHQSRHSFGTEICLSQGVPIETLSKMMGHASIKTTQIYAEVTRTKINEDMTKLAKQIKGKYRFQRRQEQLNGLSDPKVNEEVKPYRKQT